MPTQCLCICPAFSLEDSSNSLHGWVHPSISIPAHTCCYCLVAKSCLTLLWPHGLYSPPGSSVHGISQASTLEWVIISFSRGWSLPRDQTCVFCIGRWILYHWATWEAPAEMLLFYKRSLPWPPYLKWSSHLQLRSTIPIWFGSFIEHTTIWNYVCICSLSGSLPLEHKLHKEQTFSVLLTPEFGVCT